MRTLSTLVLVLGLAACRGGDDGGGGGNPDSNTGNSDDTTIQQIQNDSMPACDPANPATCVELKIKGVIVTAIDAYGSKTGDFWVEEPGGGPFSGVHVYGAPLDQVSALAIGDVVDIAGAEKSEFALSSDTSGNKLTELEPVQGGTMSVTKVMSGTPITPDVVDALTIGQMSDFMARDAEWEKWEGVLVKVNNVYATSNDTCVGSMCTDATLHKFGITGDVQVESSLSAMPMPTVARDACLGSVTGVVDYFFDYQILPRTTDEIAQGGTSCPPLETSDLLCGDGVDNDGNGFADCMDFGCQTNVAACVSHPMISDIQAGTATGYVQLDNVYVAAVSFNKKNLWLTQSLTAAANQGIYVYRGNATSVAVLDASIVVGAQVTVKGLVQEGNNDATGDTLTQITNPTVTFVAAPTTAPVPVVGQTAETMMANMMSEPYESVLVTLTNVKIKTAGTSAGFYVGEFEQANATTGTTTFLSDDDILRLTDPANTCYATVTGIWTYQVFNNAYGLLPISTTSGGTCP